MTPQERIRRLKAITWRSPLMAVMIKEMIKTAERQLATQTRNR